jgi:hypothetical protein
LARSVRWQHVSGIRGGIEDATPISYFHLTIDALTIQDALDAASQVLLPGLLSLSILPFEQRRPLLFSMVRQKLPLIGCRPTGGHLVPGRRPQGRVGGAPHGEC